MEASLAWARVVEKQSHLKYIWKLESIGLDDGQVGCVVEETREIKNNIKVLFCLHNNINSNATY